MSIQIEDVYGSEVLNIYNHNDYGNPHSQYVTNNKNTAVSPYIIDGKYYKLLSVEIEDLKRIRKEAEYLNSLQLELNSLKASNAELSKILEKQNEIQRNGYKSKKDYVSNFEIAMNVYEKSNYGCSICDNKWDLLLKISHSHDFFPQNVQVKLVGKEQRAILVVSESVRKEEHRYSEFEIRNNQIVESGFKASQVEIPILRYDLYILLNQGCDIRFVKTFLNSTTDNYEIYNKGKCVNYIPITEEEKKLLIHIMEWNRKNKINEQKIEEITKVIDNSNDNIVNKFVSKTNDMKINFPSVPNYFEKFIQLFEVNINFNEVYYSSYNGVWEILVSDGLGGIEFREKDRVQYAENHKLCYIKFMIYASNTAQISNDGSIKYKYAFELEILEFKNMSGKKLYVKADPGTGKFGIWISCDYPQTIEIKPCINNLENGEYNRLRINQENMYVGFIPDNMSEVEMDTLKYSYYEGI